MLDHVLLAQRQSDLLALKDLLNRGEAGDFRCVYVNVEAAQAHREDLSGAMRTILKVWEGSFGLAEPASSRKAAP